MVVTNFALETYLEELLACQQYTDYAPNGLQVQGRDEIKTIVTGVTASHALLEAALKVKADAVFVHHGYFWKGESPVIKGMAKKRLGLLLQHNVNLFAYHLPLDGHKTLGNNAQLAEVLGIEKIKQLPHAYTPSILFQGEFETAKAKSDLQKLIRDKLNRAPLYIQGHDRDIRKIAWCTGGAQDEIVAASGKVDAFLTGEVSERTYHQAKELEIDFIAAGHHATERYGIKALGEHLAAEFDITHQFIDIDNPV